MTFIQHSFGSLKPQQSEEKKIKGSKRSVCFEMI